MVTRYTPPNPHHWSGRVDGPAARRFHEVIECVDLNQASEHHLRQSIAILGFACDVGIRRNLGRPGAAEGPQALRQALGKLPIHFHPLRLIDVGTVTCLDDDLESSQLALSQIVVHLLHAQSFPLILGGGHEVVWGHDQGIASAYPNARIGLINFDAHFDLRPLLEGGLGSSGTSFRQVANSRQARGMPFDYLCMGIQRFSNTQALFQEAQQLGVVTIPAETLRQESQGKILAHLDQFLTRCDMVYVTLCMDVFAEAFAPGVSAPQPLGLEPKNLLPLLRHLASSAKVIGFDIAEVSPPLDRDQQTSSLGAVLIAEFLTSVQVPRGLGT